MKNICKKILGSLLISVGLGLLLGILMVSTIDKQYPDLSVVELWRISILSGLLFSISLYFIYMIMYIGWRIWNSNNDQ